MNENSIVTLLKAEQTVFRTTDLALFWHISDGHYLKTKIYRLVKAGKLHRVRNGIYTVRKDYDTFEAANKLVIPSYVSLRSVLATAGVIFQYDATIYSIARLSAERIMNNQRYVYRKIHDDIFFQKRGVITTGSITTATPERALLDWMYLEKDISVDNLEPLDQKECWSLLPLYNNKLLEKRLKALFD